MILWPERGPSIEEVDAISRGVPGGSGGAGWSVLHAQKPFREYPGLEYENFALPPDWDAKTEWTRARLKCPEHLCEATAATTTGRSTIRVPTGTSRRRAPADAHRYAIGGAGNRADGTDDIYNWPMLYAVEVGHWYLPDEQAAQLRDFLLRGGFLMVDDFHGSEDITTASMNGKCFSTASTSLSRPQDC